MKARLPQGYGGGGANNMNSMLKQAQKMQEDMENIRKELDEKEYSVSVGGGAVEVTANGKHQVTAINIKPEVVDPDDVEMLGDLLIGAINEVMRKVDEDAEQEMGKVSGGFNIPGLF